MRLLPFKKLSQLPLPRKVVGQDRMKSIQSDARRCETQRDETFLTFLFFIYKLVCFFTVHRFFVCLAFPSPCLPLLDCSFRYLILFSVRLFSFLFYPILPFGFQSVSEMPFYFQRTFGTKFRITKVKKRHRSV